MFKFAEKGESERERGRIRKQGRAEPPPRETFPFVFWQQLRKLNFLLRFSINGKSVLHDTPNVIHKSTGTATPVQGLDWTEL